jgi:hypothetical protein
MERGTHTLTTCAISAGAVTTPSVTTTGKAGAVVVVVLAVVVVAVVVSMNKVRLRKMLWKSIMHHIWDDENCEVQGTTSTSADMNSIDSYDPCETDDISDSTCDLDKNHNDTIYDELADRC